MTDSANDQAAHQHRIVEAAQRRVQDSINRQTRLAAQSTEQAAVTEQRQQELDQIRRSIVIDYMTPKERHDLLTAAQLAVDAIDNDDA